ncbi:sarcosine oxidase subunit beta [Deinobacterium chartae]|uniref:Sarcosine oxidase subunit beta n=1 Tax=Deinobacterium chartae TaxID=521158 RepID=A0A841HW68_9DEIO|nr:FAD-binding oxidoreductase [Deinobacterium chartae]MBB6097083.1 sarcosine oxidase subunit beta [Deinobacterium chartae]
MNTPYDVLIIGAGIVGACAALELTRRGQRVAVLEAEGPARGITRWCPGGVRQQWSSDLNVQLVRDSLPFFREIHTLDPALRFEDCGYLFVTHTEQGVEHMRQLVEHQRCNGVNARLLTPDEVRALCPHLSDPSVTAASYGPDDGFVNDPIGLTRAILEAALRGGATLIAERATALTLEGGRVVGARTEQREWRATVTVLAAGHGARELAASAGLDLPLHAEERRLHFLTGLPAADFCTTFVASLEKRWAGKQIGESFYMSYLGELPEDDATFRELTFQQGEQLLPGVRQLQTTRVVHGFYSSTPDFQAIVDAPSELPGLVLSVGFNGNGFMMAPANARLVAALALGETPPYDHGDYRLARFTGEVRRETAVI